MKEFNKVIWIFWMQGWEGAPDVCKKCLDTWKKFNPNWTINIIDNKNLHSFINPQEIIPDILSKEIDYTVLSEIIRIGLLKKYGGVWVDATTYCNDSLDNWLHKIMPTDFFAFDRSADKRTIASWFLVANKNSYIINKWYEYLILYWNGRKSRSDYFWLHYLFGSIYNIDVNFKKNWDAVYKINANNPAQLNMIGILNPITEEIIKNINYKLTPMYKLTYKFEHDKLKKNSIIYYLLNKK